MSTPTEPTAAPAEAASPPCPSVPPTAIISTASFYIRPYEVSDAEALARGANDLELARHMRTSFPSPYTLEDAHWWIAHCHSNPHPPKFGIFTPDGQFAGALGLQTPGDSVYAGTRELGYYTVRKFWGRGLMTEAVKMFARWAFETHEDIIRIEAMVFGLNEGSMKVLRKAGFVEEGTKRLAVVKNGVRMDEVIFGLVRSDLS
ncbi:acyl-CoA N-acyltransferase [Astrocystis sublimbata]|nr:acyl-CoA N-acyltransferase [Astrocystis sublimbata]